MVVFFIQSSQGIFPQKGIWTICCEKETVKRSAQRGQRATAAPGGAAHLALFQLPLEGFHGVNRHHVGRQVIRGSDKRSTGSLLRLVSATRSASLLFKQAGLDVLQHGAQLLLHFSLGDGHLGTRVPPHRHALTLLQVFGAHLQTNRNPLQEDPRLMSFPGSLARRVEG